MTHRGAAVGVPVACTVRRVGESLPAVDCSCGPRPRNTRCLLLSLAGALGYVPLCFVMPCAMFLRVRRGELSTWQVSWA